MARGNNRSFFSGGISLGVLVAFALSWFKHHSVLWAIVHAIYSWFYVAYYALTESGMLAPISASLAMAVFAISLASILAIVVIVMVALSIRR